MAGLSFALLMDYFKAQGLTTNKVTLTPDTDVAINPRLTVMQLLDEDYDDKKLDEVFLKTLKAVATSWAKWVTLALAMATGGEQKSLSIFGAQIVLFSRKRFA